MFETFKKALQIKEIRNRILITLFIVFIYRLLGHVPLPGIDREGLAQLFSSNQLLGLADVFSGGSLSRFSLTTVGIGPYISSSIAMQMFTFTIPSLKELQKEGAYGMEKINKYTKYLTLPIALIQSLGIYILFSRQGLLPNLDIITTVTLILSLVAGAFIVMWLGDLITEQDIGNGISIIVLVSILAAAPASSQAALLSTQAGNFFNVIFSLAVALLVVMGIVFVNDAIRKIPVKYASSNRASYSGDNYLPLKVNQAGVIPIIFAVALVILPSFLGNFITQAGIEPLMPLGVFLNKYFATGSLYYNLFYFFSVFIFTFLYTAVTFNPEDIAENLRNRGGYIPGIRPGKATLEYLNTVLTRITFVGALFLGFVAILPNIAAAVTGISSITIGGAGVLIVVSVILESMKKIDSQVIMYEYDNVAMN